MSTLHVTYELCSADYRDVFVAYRKASFFRRWLQRIIVSLATLILGLEIALFIIDQSNPNVHNAYLNLRPLAVLAVLWLLVFLVFPHFNARKQFQNSPSSQGTIRLEADDKGIHVISAITDTKTEWTAYVRWLEGSEVFAVMSSPVVFMVIPKRAFTPEQLTLFRELLRTKIAGKK